MVEAGREEVGFDDVCAGALGGAPNAVHNGSKGMVMDWKLC